MPPADRGPSLRQALALGLLQGPSELLPVSSSAHTTLLPWLAGGSYAALPGSSRKSLEIALHAGAGLALAASLAGRGDLGSGESEEPAGAPPAGAVSPGVLAGAVGLPALIGVSLGARIERRLGGPRSIAAGLLAGSLAMALADRRPAVRFDPAQAGLREGMALGAAQAVALVPGVSRNGATLATARALGFDREASQRLSWAVGLPVLLGVSLRELARPMLDAARGGGDPRQEADRPGPAILLAGAAAAFASSALSARVAWRRLRAPALAPFALYRAALATVVLVRSRRAK